MMMPRLYAFVLVLATAFVATGLPLACSHPSGAPAPSEPDASVLGSPSPTVDPTGGIHGLPARAPHSSAPPAPLPPLPRKVVVDKRSQEAQLVAACTDAHGVWWCKNIPHQQLMGASGNATAANCGPACTVGVWDVDPLNTSGCASDGNSCTSATCGSAGIGPCSTRAQIIQRVGSPTPIYPFAQSVSINYVSQGADSGADPWFAPQLSGGATLSFTGAGYYSSNWTTLGNTYVFRPGGVPGGNVYTSWPALYAALPPLNANGTRPPSTIVFDLSYVAYATTAVPAAAYNLDEVTFQQVNPIAGGQLQFPNGATVSFTELRIQNASVDYAGAGSLFTMTGASTAQVNIVGPGETTTSGGGKLVSVGGTSSFIMTCLAGTQGDGVHTLIDVSSAGALGLVFMQAGAFANTNMMTNSGSGTALLDWDLELPNAQGAGVSVSQAGAGNVMVSGIVGDNVRGLPVKDKVTAATSFAASFALSTAQIATPTIVGSGTVPGGGTTITLPNVVGAKYSFDLHAVTLTGTLTFSAGTGATPASVTAAQLSASGAQGVVVEVTASNVCVRVS